MSQPYPPEWEPVDLASSGLWAGDNPIHLGDELTTRSPMGDLRAAGIRAHFAPFEAELRAIRNALLRRAAGVFAVFAGGALAAVLVHRALNGEHQ